MASIPINYHHIVMKLVVVFPLSFWALPSNYFYLRAPWYPFTNLFWSPFFLLSVFVTIRCCSIPLNYLYLKPYFFLTFRESVANSRGAKLGTIQGNVTVTEFE